MRNFVRVFAILFAVAFSSVISSNAGSASLHVNLSGDPSWGPLQFLVGTWGAGENDKPEASTYSFAPELGGHVLVRHCVNGCDKGPMGPGYSDILYIYTPAPGQPYRAIFFDSVGHVLQYDVSATDPNKVVFLSDGPAAAPKFRLTYELAAGKMAGKFEMLPPGDAPARVLSTWSGAKK